MMTIVSEPKGARRDCGANANDAMSIRPQLAESTTPKTLSRLRFLCIAHRWGVKAGRVGCGGEAGE